MNILEVKNLTVAFAKTVRSPKPSKVYLLRSNTAKPLLWLANLVLENRLPRCPLSRCWAIPPLSTGRFFMRAKR